MLILRVLVRACVDLTVVCIMLTCYNATISFVFVCCDAIFLLLDNTKMVWLCSHVARLSSLLMHARTSPVIVHCQLDELGGASIALGCRGDLGLHTGLAVFRLESLRLGMKNSIV
jgi:hypothetical protein